MNHNDNPVKVIKTEKSGNKSLGEGLILFKGENYLPLDNTKSIAMVFVEWVVKSEFKWYHKTTGKWSSDNKEFSKSITTEELFDIFIKQYKP